MGRSVLLCGVESLGPNGALPARITRWQTAPFMSTLEDAGHSMQRSHTWMR